MTPFLLLVALLAWATVAADDCLGRTAPLPAPPAVTSPSPTNDRTPTWTWASGGGTGVYRYRYAGIGPWIETSATGFTPAAALPAGTFTLAVQERDAAGRWSAAGWKAVEVDLTPPRRPAVTAEPLSRDPTPTWRWQSQGGGIGVYRFRLDNEPWSGPTRQRQLLPAAALLAGAHTLLVQERDAAGNWSAAGRKVIVVDPSPRFHGVCRGEGANATCVQVEGLGLDRCGRDSDCGPGQRIYVAPYGRDSAPGTYAQPLASLAGARDRLRTRREGGPLTEPVTVYLRAGTYCLAEPLRLEAQDSGTPAAPIAYCAYPGERPVLSGGVPIVGPWRPVSRQIWVTHVGPLRFRSLFVDGERAVRAREPDAGDPFPYYRIIRREDCLYQEPPIWPDACYDRFRFRPGDLSASWQRLQDIEIVSLARWLQPRFRLAQVDEAGQLAQVSRTIGDGFLFGFDYDGRDRYYVENFLEGLDTPGEWYLDQTSGDLYYYPLPDRPITGSSFIAPQLGQLLQLGDVAAMEALVRGYYGVYDDPRFGFEEQDFSVSVWLLFPAGSANPGWPLSKGNAYFETGWGVASWSEGEDPVPSVDLFVNDGRGPLPGVSAGSLARDQWGHFVWTVDRGANTITAYRDGVFVQEVSLPPEFGSIATSLPLEIGRYAGSMTFNGSMDELRLFDRVLAATEVQSLFEENTCSGPAPILELSLDGHLSDSAPEPAPGTWHVQSTFVDGPFGQGLDFAPAGGEPLTGHPAFIHDLLLSGLELAHTDWTLGPLGNPGSQANYALQDNPAAVAIAGAGVTLERCRIAHTGADAIRIYGQRVAVRGCQITDAGAAGIVVGSPWSADYNYQLVASLAQDNRLEDNVILSFGQVFREGAGITLFMGPGNRIAHNRIAHGAYSGIAAGWWSPPAWGSRAGGNIIESNEIFDVVRALNDGAGIYTNGAQPGTIIRRNVIHDIVATREHPPDADLPGTFIWGIYLDGTAAQLLVQDNLVYRTAWGGIMLNNAVSGNRDNLVTNNILVDGQTYQLWLGGATLDRFERNIVYQAGDSQLFAIDTPDAIGLSDYNLFFAAQSPDLGPEWLQWRSLGFDAHSIIADPGFADPSRDDFTIGPPSPAVTELGFVMPDLSSVGPRED
ncbi:MAG: LamG-like jellyroll fold domain-containing protein [Thermodesulfobacteriota bacterium]